MSNNENVQKILEGVDHIPPLPSVITQVMTLTRDPDVSPAELSKVITTDEALTADLLKLCNSSYYGLPRVISSVTQAIMYLGFQTIRNMLLTSSMDRLFRGYDLTAYGHTESGLSEHSTATAIAATCLSKKLRPGLSDTSYTAGLLHDVGKILICGYIKQEGIQFSPSTSAGVISIEDERAALGTDHAEIGAFIADKWNFPQELILAIGSHHNPDSAPGRPLLAAITYLANNIAMRLGNGYSAGPQIQPVSDYCVDSTGFGEAEMPELLAEVENQVASFGKPPQQKE